MQAVRAVYKEGNIQLLSPIPQAKEAELLILVLDKNEQASEIVKSLHTEIAHSEQEFQTIGLTSFFATEDDANVDWEELFDVKSR